VDRVFSPLSGRFAAHRFHAETPEEAKVGPEPIHMYPVDHTNNQGWPYFSPLNRFNRPLEYKRFRYYKFICNARHANLPGLYNQNQYSLYLHYEIVSNGEALLRFTPIARDLLVSIQPVLRIFGDLLTFIIKPS
jgi:hypothetical protein